jgi:GxxExxY protein
VVDILEQIEQEKLIYREETYRLIGACMEVHRVLGRGFLEVVYKDALEHEFRSRQIPYSREKSFTVQYKGISLRHSYVADFILFDKVVLEVKAQLDGMALANEKQVLNYLAISKCRVGILVNFGDLSLTHKRIVL